MSEPIQNYYADKYSHCYGCGRLNEVGLHIQSFWDGEGAVCDFAPRPEHTAVPGYVYGGLIASLVDCHCVGAAAAALYAAEGRALGSDPPIRCVTASLHVDYLAPTPLGAPLRIKAVPVEVKEKKVRVRASVLANGVETARGELVAVRIPDDWLERLAAAR